MTSCPFGYMVQIVERGRVAEPLDGSCSACTYWYCCRQAELEERLVDIDPKAHQLRIVPVLLYELALCELGLEQLGLVACSKLRLAVAAAFLELVTGSMSSISNSLAAQMAP